MYGLMGKIRAHPGKREDLLAHLLDTTHLDEMEGCYLYLVSRATDDEDGIWVTEVWRSAEDHQASLRHEAIQKLIAIARPLIAEITDRTEFTPAGGRGLPG